MSPETITALQPFGETALFATCITLIILALLKTVRVVVLALSKQKDTEV